MPRFFALLALAGCRGCADPSDTAGEPLRWEDAGDLGARAVAFGGAQGRLLAGTWSGLLESADGASFTPAEGLPEGAVTFVGALPEASLCWVDGHGLYRDAGAGWTPVAAPPDSALLGLLSPRARAVPFAVAGDAGGAWLAAAGGLFSSGDGGASWEGVDLSSETGFNLLFSTVAVQGERVAAGAFRPAGLLPPAYADLLTTALLVSEDGGATWRDAGQDLPARYPTGLALDDDGALWLAAQDGGLFRETTAGWEALGGPTDAVGLALEGDDALVLSATRGAWVLHDGAWTGLDAGPMVGLAGGRALAEDGRLLALTAGAGEVPAAGDATVHLALSFHVNLYHSYRGDSNDDDGYGQDLRVLRAILDWLDANPTLRADWDFDNAFSLDGWLRTDGADVLARIQARVAKGQDGVRLMSWNNGALANETREEFDASIAWAQDSLAAAFGGFDPGVQPQECMVSPEHLGWYRDLGVEWITLFNSGTPFTALRGQVELPEEAWYAPFTLSAAGGSLTAVPAYHHGDVLDHGGLLGWAEQIHAARTGDQVLLVHFDADAETWEAFDAELAPVLDLPWVRPTTLQDYLDAHDPVAEVELGGDLADGTGDGFQSWAEKAFDHEIATGIAEAREHAAQAAALAPDDPGVQALLADALEARLLALSTTHFGLAAPYLHPDRQASARAYLGAALSASDQALTAAAALVPVDPGRILVVNTRASAGTALVDVPLRVAAADWQGPDGLHVRDEEGQELAMAVQVIEEGEERVTAQVSLVVALEALERRVLRWGYDASIPPATGGLTADAALLDLPLVTPFTECDGAVAPARETEALALALDARGAVLAGTQHFDLDLCGEPGSLSWTRKVHAGLPGVVFKVSTVLGAPKDAEGAESVALSPLACAGSASSLTWRTFGGAEPTRAVRAGLASWNGQAADGWVSLHCDDGTDIRVSHRVTERDSLAFAPLRTVDGTALLAPLGTLWGPPPRHDARRTGGHGLGDVTVGLVGSQFQPSAPDWSGMAPGYQLLVGDDVDPGTLDLFAHPPLVKVGGT